MRHKVLEKRSLGSDIFILRLERKGMIFLPGQYIHLGIPGQRISREYSIYSSIDDDSLEVLFKRIPAGALTPWLSEREPGDTIELQGPFGEFFLSENEKKQPILFTATGTGISPFHCFAKSNPDLNYRLLHGIPDESVHYETNSFRKQSYIPCLSRQKSTAFQGRVTDWLKVNTIDSYKQFMICGNTDMIYQVFSILNERGIKRSQIKVETYW